MLFSILIPNLGFNDYFCRCIDSIALQQEDNSFNYEVLICDQSDPDDYNKIIKYVGFVENKYNKKNIKVFQSSIKHVLKARHFLIQKASGDYIVFIDSDDYVDNDYLIQLFYKIKKNDEPDIFIHNYFIYSEGNISPHKYPADLSEHILDYFLLTNHLNSIVIKTFKRRLYNINEYKDFETKNGDDWVLSYPLMKAAKTICFDDSFVKYYYRIRRGSITRTIDYNEAINTLSFRINSIKPMQLNLYQNSLFTKYYVEQYSFLLSVLKNETFKKIKKFTFHARSILLSVVKECKTNLLTKKQKILLCCLKHHFNLLIFLFAKLK